MATKLHKKGRHPGAVDNWLDGLGYYRKNVAYDETCLFRAVCEQLFDCQVYHERVRRECVEYARKNYEEFMYLVKSLDQLFEHLDKLEKHMVVCGNFEIQIISRKYNKDVMVFDSAKQQFQNVTNRNLPESLLLCLMGEDHYDVVYEKEHIITAGFCQSIIYRCLYENVYKIPDVLDIVNGMLYDKTYLLAQTNISSEKSDFGHQFDDVSLPTSPEEETDENKNVIPSTTQPVCVAPFPFKVAKALDPTIYRNIEYDSWTEVRRELRLGEWYYGDDKLILGTRCVYTDPKSTSKFECYIQNILKEQNKCVIYITKLAERRTVSYNNLSPEDDAKPWPLPYRFSKNLVLSMPNEQTTTEKPKMQKKKKDKRRTQSCSEVGVQFTSPNTESVEHDINAYVGAPLQMQIPMTTPDSCPVNHNVVVSQDSRVSPGQYVPEQQWNGYIQPSSQPLAWPQTPATPQTMYSYNMKPLVASAPVTPEVIPYHDMTYPYCYNYQVDLYNGYGAWINNPEYQIQQTQDPIQKENHEAGAQESPCPQQQQNRTVQCEHVNPQPSSSHTQVERPVVCTTLTPTSPQMEVYSPIIPIHPGTPIVYTQHPHPEMTEMIVSSAPIPVYTPPVDNIIVTPTHYIYPPTPPTSWYPPGINAQGFIFPSPVTPQNITK